MTGRIGAMQPYLFPYLGYFQLISAVDIFVLSDDLQYISKGWINRNRVLINGQAQYIQFPLKKDDHLKQINERVLADDFAARSKRLLKAVSQAYARAPCFDTAFPVIERIVNYPETSLARYAENSLRELCDYLHIDTPLLPSSGLCIDPMLDGQDWVIETVKRLDGDVYINAIGGTSLYHFDRFERSGLELKFLRMDDIRYRQFRNDFVPSLSIIDVMMFNDTARIRELLGAYSLSGRPEAGTPGLESALPFMATLPNIGDKHYGHDDLHGYDDL